MELLEDYQQGSDPEPEYLETRQLISQKYLDGHYDECIALVIDQLTAIADSFIKKTEQPQMPGRVGSMFSHNRTPGTKTRLMHQCNRDGKCKCCDLLVFYLSLLHLTEDTDDINQKLEAVQINEPAKRVPFKALVAWVQLEMYQGRLAQAETLINGYIQSSSHLADPKPPKPVSFDGDKNEDQDSSEDNKTENADVLEHKTNSKNNDSQQTPSFFKGPSSQNSTLNFPKNLDLKRDVSR